MVFSMFCHLCEQCDLFDAVDQLISSQLAITDATNATNVTVGVSQFPVFAAGCLLYLSSPNLVCAATKQGQWGDRTNAFIHKLTHTEEQPGHQHMDLSGLLVLIHDLHHHYKPSNTEVRLGCRSKKWGFVHLCWFSGDENDGERSSNRE